MDEPEQESRVSDSTPSTIDLQSMSRSLDGDVVLPGDETWDSARQAWNLAADQHPAAVAHAAGPADVARVVDFGRRHGLRVAPQATGHGAGVMGPLEATILLKTDRMTGVAIDASARRARIEAGTLAADVAVGAGEAGLAALLGTSPDTGVIGYTLGGGAGWLGRRYGLAANSVTAIEVVTADGRQRRVDAETDGQLFFALRGGGGSFGAVTAIELELYPVAEVYAGTVAWPVEMGSEIAHAYRDWLATAPDEITAQLRFLNLPPLPDLPEPLRGRSIVDVTGAYVGDPAAGEELMRPLRELGGVVWDTWGVQPVAELRRLAMDPEQPVPGMGDHVLLGELTPEAVDALVRVGGADSGTPLIGLQVRQLGGALARERDGAGALGSLDGEHVAFGVGAVVDEASRAAVNEHLDLVSEELAPYSTGRRFLNFAERPGDVSAFFSPEAWRRLTAAKAEYDPGDLFRANHPVPVLRAP
jgi:FAD/FMN-containing dehydrogenase